MIVQCPHCQQIVQAVEVQVGTMLGTAAGGAIILAADRLPWWARWLVAGGLHFAGRAADEAVGHQCPACGGFFRALGSA